MRLTAECSLLASGYLGFGISDYWDGNAYIIHSRGEAIIIDTGAGRSSDALVSRAERLLDGAQLRAILVTHGHVDHSGGAATLARAFDAPVLASARCAEIIRTGDEETIGLPGARREGVYPADQRLEAVAATTITSPLDIGDVRVTPMATPGHSADHMVFVAETPSGRGLFSGDLVFPQGRIAHLATPDADLIESERSIRAVASLGIDQLFAGHGAAVLGGASAHLQAAIAAFDRGERPPSLLS
ncbi:MBL fold metallo-hydrolase [Salinibacterium sp. M195]|uniref:MBL fold metallo-hydrolase n=1 Tax=Salinibacterium sp. M195 TaxID=2583374 RepID=UPI001C630DE4|nr:MBL fold metallo-hydrolase [Salinibacterium sp. M195]QYH35267.1 MBL fold metallo-hydrolase [Salinibacterium sp. M195]